jgi:hypothetical protein
MTYSVVGSDGAADKLEPTENDWMNGRELGAHRTLSRPCRAYHSAINSLSIICEYASVHLRNDHVFL